MSCAPKKVMSEPVSPPSYTLKDLRAGNPEADDPLECFAWPELRELIYGGEGP